MEHKTLLDLGRTPTLAELREFFGQNDWSASAYTKIDYENTNADEIEFMNYTKSLMDEHLKPLSREMGMKADTSYYGANNPLVAMSEGLENIVANSVLKLLNEQPDYVASVLEHFLTEKAVNNFEEFSSNVDDMLHNAVKLTLETMSFEEVANTLNQMPAHEDFNYSKSENFRAKDFDRKWNHTRSQVKTVSVDDVRENVRDGTEYSSLIVPSEENLQDQVVMNILKETFWSSISDEDRSILQMQMDGHTQKEIAEAHGFKTHSAVTKRLQKLKTEFLKSNAS